MPDPEHFAAVAARHFTRLTETPMTQPLPAVIPAHLPPNNRVRQVAEWWVAGVIADPSAAMAHICGILGVKIDTDARSAGQAVTR